MGDLSENIFIVYSAKDDPVGDVISWNDNFKRFLELLLVRLSGKQVNINYVKDSDLDIASIYSTYTILIPLVTDSLLNSSNFNEEIKLFHEKAINKEHNSISWNSRIFKVLRKSINGHFLLDYLSNSQTYNFFHYDQQKGEIVQYDDFTGEGSEKTFWMRLYDLAYDVSRIFNEIKSAEQEINKIQSDLNAITVYLAEVGSDISELRDSLKRELLRHGYKVLPEKTIPENIDDITKLIKKDIAASSMSIHLVGSDYAKVKGTNTSIIDLQNKLATEHFRDLEKFGTSDLDYQGSVIWISPKLSTINVKQRLFIDNLKRTSETIKNTELLETTFEDLKSYVINRLEEGKKELQRSGISEKGKKGKVVYLIYDKKENAKCKEIEQYLIANGYSVITSDFEGNPDEIRNMHNENLRRCDATLIYYGNENKQWVNSKQKDLLKALGLGRDKPINPKAILVESEGQLDEILGIDDEAMILYSTSSFSPKTIEPFLAQLEK